MIHEILNHIEKAVRELQIVEKDIVSVTKIGGNIHIKFSSGNYYDLRLPTKNPKLTQDNIEFKENLNKIPIELPSKGLRPNDEFNP